MYGTADFRVKFLLLFLIYGTALCLSSGSQTFAQRAKDAAKHHAARLKESAQNAKAKAGEQLGKLKENAGKVYHKVANSQVATNLRAQEIC